MKHALVLFALLALGNAPVPPPKPANAWSPGEGFWKDFPKAWRQTVDGQVNRAKQGGINVMFIGDSLTQGWDKTLWKERFVPLGAVNFGIGGDGTPQVLWRIEHGILDGCAPKLVVLMIGINNVWPGYSADDTARGIEAVVAAIRQKQPQTKVLLLGVLPIFGKDDKVRTWLKTVNTRIAKLADTETVRFLNLGDKFVEADGALREGFYQPDRLHLKQPAYQLLTDAIEPVIKEMLK